MFKFQLCTSSGFGIISQLINFQANVFLGVNSRPRDLGSPKLANMTLSLILMLRPNFNFLDFSLLVISKIKGTTRLRKVPSIVQEMG